jgi:two-component system, sensor histidine kinase
MIGACWFQTRILPLKDSEGCVVRWFGANTDISEKRAAADAPAAAKVSAEAARQKECGDSACSN